MTRHAISLFGFTLSIILTILEILSPFLTQQLVWLTVAFCAIPVTVLTGYVSLVGLGIFDD